MQLNPIMDDITTSNKNTSNTEVEIGKESSSSPKNLSVELRNVFTLDDIKQEVGCWNQFLDYLRGRTGASTKSNYFNKICGLCLAQPKEQKLLFKFRKTGLHSLNLFLLNSTKKEVQSVDVKLLTWCCLSLLSFYSSKHQNQNEGCDCFKMHKLQQSKAVFRNAMYLVLPEKQNDVIKYTIKYITITEQWNSEDYDTFVFQELLTMVTKPELLVAKIIKQTEYSLRHDSIKEALNISYTLSSILEHAYWDKYLFNHLLHNCFNTLLKLYLICNTSGPSSIKIENSKFRMVMKTCIKYFIANIKDNKGLVSVMDSIAKCLHDTSIAYEDRVDITEMIVYCAQKHQTKFYRESMTPDLLDLLLNNILSNDKNLAMTSHKVFHNLLDRRDNIRYFTEPVYYFKGRSDFVVNHDYGIEDIHFFKSFSKKLLDGIHHSFIKFCDKYELIICYVTLCLVLVELPEPVITINVIHVVITTQNDIFKISDLSMTVRAHFHAIASALMSLICVIHQEEVNSLKRYVEEVVRFRTENSPHLLPPLQNKYSVASHHTTDYHDQLYFLEEEILYALQRCWLGRRVTGSK